MSHGETHCSNEADDEAEKYDLCPGPMRRNLLQEFEKSVELPNEHMNVYLRIRPFSSLELAQNEDQGCVEVVDRHTVTANPPRDSHSYRFQQYWLKKSQHNFTFSGVFDESASQKEFFDSTMLRLVKDFIDGQNCLVFTYGVTNSGKTYTLQGCANDAGILPRGLDVLFNSIHGKQCGRLELKPHMFNSVRRLSPEQAEAESKDKERIMRLNAHEDSGALAYLADDCSSSQSTIQSEHSDTTGTESLTSLKLAEDVENRVREVATVDVTHQGRIRFSVWVTFSEVYNEQIFDLLEPMSKMKCAKRPILKISEDRKGRPYIKGLKEINVTSADEAYRLLTIGQRNLRIACTRLNHTSSRSHCVFNIKIIRVSDVENPQLARVSTFSLCDLAGSERQNKAQTFGDRLKEAGSIHTSLLTLGRCIDLLRYNQLHKDREKIVPFRESRLTRLLQNFLSGRGRAAMIVNVNRCASMFDETLSVFRFSAVAKQVVIHRTLGEPIGERRLSRRKISISCGSKRPSSIAWADSVSPSRSQTDNAEEGSDEGKEELDDEAYIEYLERQVESLQETVKQMRHDRLAKEVTIRKEVCQEMSEQFVRMDAMYNDMMRKNQEEDEIRFEQKLKLITDCYESQPSKRARLDDDEDNDGVDLSDKALTDDDDDEWVSSVLLYQEKEKVKDCEDNLAQMQEHLTEQEFRASDLEKRLAISEQSLALAVAKKSCVDVGVWANDADLHASVHTLSRQLEAVESTIHIQEQEMGRMVETVKSAGEESCRKERQVVSLTQAVADWEERSQQQLTTVRELRCLLSESKTAVADADNRLGEKNKVICGLQGDVTALNEMVQELQVVGDVRVALSKCREDLSSTQNRLKLEEEDFQQRQKALIHGYTAEINLVKSQMTLLKSQRLGKCVATSPMRLAALGKSLSPIGTPRGRLRGQPKVGKSGVLDDALSTSLNVSVRLDFVRLMKELEQELIQKNSGLPKSLKQRLQDVIDCAHVLQTHSEERSDVVEKLQQVQFELHELQTKFEEMSESSANHLMRLDARKMEPSDNQSKSDTRVFKAQAKDALGSEDRSMTVGNGRMMVDVRVPGMRFQSPVIRKSSRLRAKQL